MSEPYKPKNLIRDRIANPPSPRAEPREQVVYRDGKPTILEPLLCREHSRPWLTCTLCSKVRIR